jgi:hypothetical protein
MNEVSLELLLSDQSSALFMLFSQPWFISIWNDYSDQEIEESGENQVPSYKVELCLSLFQTSLRLLKSVK